jgi:hypothetical protein
MIPDIDIWGAAMLLVNLTVKTPRHRRPIVVNGPIWVKLGCSDATAACPLFQRMETSAGTADTSHSCQ